MKRTAGILMPIASLPTRDGIGGFGRQAYQFVDILARMGVGIWQILPLNPLGYGNSPYQPYSSYAGEPLYIDLETLEKEGLLQPGREACPDGGSIDYEQARAYREPYLKEAYRNFRAKSWEEPEFRAFREGEWVYPYAVFMALKKQNGLKCWNDWPRDQQNWILDRQYDISHLEDEIGFQLFLQYQFYRQWMALKTYANAKNVQIMGDVPFYVGQDSQDVWMRREEFLLDEQWRPAFVAGVPPDFFSKTGQRWGNPIYNWENMEKNGFSFWLDRLGYSASLYDIIRIDHFRAFDTYWKVPASCPTAEEGDWIEAPGYAFFETLYRRIPDIKIVAEDLGELRPEVLELRDAFHLMGMNVMEFNLPEHDEVLEHQLIYTGTHDNQTVKSWYRDQSRRIQAIVRKKLAPCSRPGESISNKMVRYAYASEASLAIVPLADILGLDDTARINTPGTVGSPNWEWRLKDFRGLRRKANWLRQILEEAGRI